MRGVGAMTNWVRLPFLKAGATLALTIAAGFALAAPKNPAPNWAQNQTAALVAPAADGGAAESVDAAAGNTPTRGATPSAADAASVEEIVVTGIRASLESAQQINP